MSHDHDEVHARPVAYYVANFCALMVLLVITVWVSFYHFGDTINVAIMLTIAVVKMTLVVLIFMDVLWGSRLTQVFAAAGFLWLMIMFVLTFSDYVSRDAASSIGIKGDPHAISILGDEAAHGEVMAHQKKNGAHGADHEDQSEHGEAAAH